MPSITTNAINQALGGIVVDQCSLHTAFPGPAGANEIFGGTPAYARKTIAFGAASGGVRSLVSSVTFDVPAGDVAWVGFWGAGLFLWYSPNGGATPKEFVVDTTANVVRSPSHGYSNATPVTFFGGTTPNGVLEGNVYYVITATTDTFQVSETIGGAAIVLGTSGTSDVQVCGIGVQTYASQDTHTLLTAQIGLPL